MELEFEPGYVSKISILCITLDVPTLLLRGPGFHTVLPDSWRHRHRARLPSSDQGTLFYPYECLCCRKKKSEDLEPTSPCPPIGYQLAWV